MKSLNLLSLLFKSLVIFVALSGLLVAVLDYLNLSFTLDSGPRVLVEHIKSYTGRDAAIDGDVELTVSLSPQLLVQRIHIANPENFSNKDFITVSEARVTVSLLSLLSGQWHFSDIAAEQAKVNLIKKKDGSHNWSFYHNIQPAKPTDTKTTGNDTRESGMSRVSIGEFQLTNVTISYNDRSRDQVIDTQFEQLLIDIRDRTKPHAEINGNVQGQPYSITFKSEALEIFSSGKPWLLHGTGHIAGSQTELEANLQLKDNEVNAELKINVKKVNLGLLLDKLGIISAQDATTDNIYIQAIVRGSDLAGLYQQAEIKLQLGKGYLNLQPTAIEPKKLYFSRASSFTSWHKPIELHLDGYIADEAIKLDFKTNRLEDFFDEVQKLNIDLVSSIADTDITLKGTLDLPIKTKQFNLKLSVKGKDLERLNPIINAEFPPFNDFKLTGNLIANDKGFVLKSAQASIGDTQLQTAIVIDTNAPEPLWTINLSSRQLQLKDFAFDDWNIQTTTATAKTTKQENKNEPLLKILRQLEDRVRSPKMHVNLNLKVDKVLSGEDILGKARLQLHQRDNIFTLQNANIEIPGGKIIASLSFKLENNEASGHAKLDIDKLDYGITTRLLKPGSQVDGIISARLDLQLGGNSFTRLLDRATGQIDIAAWPKNTREAKTLNLWATNLYLILLPELKKKESNVNCIVGLMNLDNGIMKEQLFAIDTTRLWIYGNINVDFSQEQVQLSLFPQSKTARLFSLQAPIRAKGSFSDIKLLLNPVDLAGSYLSFITSPLSVPTRWIFGDKIPDDGSAICEQLFNREYVIKLKAEVERKEQKGIDDMLDAD